MTDQSGTWEPDWDDLDWVMTEAIRVSDAPLLTTEVARIAVVEYRRQQAAQGKVEVDREDLVALLQCARNTQRRNSGSRLNEEIERAVDAAEAILAAAREQQ